jgi:hypothetical protein
MTLEALEFMRRFLHHVLPHRFHKLRHYRLLAPSNRGVSKALEPPLQSVPDGLGKPQSNPCV